MKHKELRKIGNSAGYRLNKQGICQGYTLGWMESMLVDEGQIFDARLDRIRKYKSSLKKDIAAAKENVKSKKYGLLADDWQVFDIMAFYERIELYHMPMEHYPGFFTKPIYQGNIDEISRIASSESILKAGGLNTVFSYSYIFTLDELEDYLEALRNILSSFQVSEDLKNTGIIISDSTHLAGVIFNHENGQWSWFMDIDDEYCQIASTKELVHSKLGFSGQIEFVPPLDEIPQKGKIYIGKKNGTLAYLQRLPLADRVLGEIDPDKLKSIPGFPVSLLSNDEPLDVEQIKPFLSQILNILSCKRHTLHTRYLPLNIKVITLNQNSARDDWRKKLAVLHNYQPITEDIAQRCGIGSLLQMAACHGDVGVVRSLLQYSDLDVNAGNRMFAALTIAAQNGHLEVVQALLQRADVDVNHRESDGATALIIASQLGHFEIVKTLLNDPDIKVTIPLHNGLTALSTAASYGHLDAVCALLPYFDVNVVSNEGATPLVLAARGGYTEVVI